MLDTIAVVANIKSFLNIYRTFKFHQFYWMNNAPEEYCSHLPREFYSSYAGTMMKFVVETKKTKRGQKDIAYT